MGHELPIVGDVMVRRKERDDGLGISRSNFQKTVKHGRGRADVARLSDEIAGGCIGENCRVVGLVKPVDDKKRSLFCQFENSAPLSFLEQGRIAEKRTELFRPFIAGNLAGQRLEASAISANQDDSPFMFELPGFAGNFVGARSLNQDRKSTRLNSSHQIISYAVFCLKKKNTHGPGS